MTRRLKDFFADTTRKRRILALDGGGVRGLLSLGVLAQLEDELRTRSGDRDYRLSQYFDLIGGTSTGSIIATALAFGWEVSEVWATYRRLMPQVFGKTIGSGILKPLFPEKPLARALRKFFENETLGSANLETGLAIFAKRANSGSAWSFCNNPGWDFYDVLKPDDEFAPNHTFLLRSLVQASAAAPHYFRGVHINIKTADPKNRKSIQGYFVDGGVCGYNNPALELLTMVRDPAYGFEWPLGAEHIYMLSVGTGFAREPQTPKGPYILQTVGALRTMINDVSLQQIAYMQAMSKVDMPWYINIEKRDQQGKSYLTPSPNLRYQRVDVRIRSDVDHDGQILPDTAEALRGEPLTDRECAEALKIANISDANAEILTDLGKRAGDRMLKLAPPPSEFDPSPWTRQGGLGPGKRRNP